MTSEQPTDAPGGHGGHADPADPATSVPPRVVLLGRAGCHLCDEARAVVERVTGELGVGWQEQSVDDDPELLRRYAEQIPVTFVDGRRHDFWRVDEARLRAALR
jgi:glutaredoxin